MQFLKRQWPIAIAFITGLLMWLRFYSGTTQSAALEANWGLWARIIVGFAAILGILSLLQHHYRKIQLKRPGFAFSYVTVAAFLLMLITGLSNFKWGVFAEGYNLPDGLHSWLYDNAMLPMQATLFATLAFFIASAAFRAFRARSPEATALLVAACIMMIGRVPVGDWLAGNAAHFQGPGDPTYSWLDFPQVATWLLNVPSAAAQRGIILGVYLSQIAISVRIIFGIERTYMGGGD